MLFSPWSLNDSILPKLVEQLRGTHDYTAFVHKEDRHAKDNRLDVAIDFTIVGTRTDYFCPNNDNTEQRIPVDFVTARFDFRSKGFRRTMLRNLVGYMVDVCRGLEHLPTVDQLFSEHDRAPFAISAAPALGLCFESVSY